MLKRESFDEIELVYELFGHGEHTKVMVDVGAHHGGSLERFARDGWRIYAFEPDRKNRNYLEEMCQVYPAVSIDQRAVSDVCETNRTFFSSEVSSGISGLTSFHPSHRESDRVVTITISAFCEEKDITRINFLKIDTEGYDLFVLKGFPWRIMKPEVILCEFEDRKTKTLGYDFHELARYLQDKGYELLVSEWYPMVEYGTQHKWRKFVSYPCELTDKKAWGNIIAIRSVRLSSKLTSLSQVFSQRFG